MRAPAIILAVFATACTAAFLMLGGWLMMGAGAQTATTCTGVALDTESVPAALVPLFREASAHYGLDPEGPAILAGLTSVESGFGRNMGPSSAGAVGWTQFMPATWAQYGVDADGDGHADPMNAADAIMSSANYLKASGAPADWHRALFAYNHADWYVRKVLDKARELKASTAAGGTEGMSCAAVPALPARGGRVVGGGRIVPIPGEPGMTIDERILPDVLALRARYRFKVNAGFDPNGHKIHGEHPLGLALDLVPGPGGTWDDIDALARWAEPTQNQPRPPFRWVGYDGDADHGRGDHLHLSWNHGPAPAPQPPAPWVDVLTATSS